MNDAQPQLFASGLGNPEGPAFDRDGNLFVVNMGSGEVSRISPEGEVSCVVNTGGIPNGAAFAENGELYICDAGLGQVLAMRPDGSWRVFTDRWASGPFMGPNDLVFDPQGNLYFTDPKGSSPQNPIGAVYFATRDGTAYRIDGGMAFPNGIAISADAERLYVVETFPRRIWSYQILEPCVLTERELFWECEDKRALLDGMAFDAEGNLWVAGYAAGSIYAVSPFGQTLATYDAGGLTPTNVAFGGSDFSTLYITECATDAVYTLDVGVRGQKLFPDQG